eukprot:scaffold10544_cov105-Isochrysis_galbana.AAC.8
MHLHLHGLLLLPDSAAHTGSDFRRRGLRKALRGCMHHASNAHRRRTHAQSTARRRRRRMRARRLRTSASRLTLGSWSVNPALEDLSPAYMRPKPLLLCRRPHRRCERTGRMSGRHLGPRASAWAPAPSSPSWVAPSW